MQAHCLWYLTKTLEMLYTAAVKPIGNLKCDSNGGHDVMWKRFIIIQISPIFEYVNQENEEQKLSHLHKIMTEIIYRIM